MTGLISRWTLLLGTMVGAKDQYMKAVDTFSVRAVEHPEETEHLRASCHALLDHYLDARAIVHAEMVERGDTLVDAIKQRMEQDK
jgi:hypothetical protein